MTKTIGSAALLGLALGAATSCSPTRDYQGHCAVQDGDAFCAEKYGDGSRPFCARGIPECELEQKDGCVPARPSDDACYSPCGGEKSAEEDIECDGIAEGSSSSGSVSATLTAESTDPTGDPTTAPTTSMTAAETEGSSSTTASGCVDSAECADAASPICADEACVPCTADAECEAKDPTAPACRDDGQCVACTAGNASVCGGDTPVCDEGQSACVGCSFHEQCSATACNIATGACFDDSCVVTVDGDGGADYQTIQAAALDGCVVIVHELDGGDDYPGVSLDGLTVALLAADGEQPLVRGLAGNPSLALTGGATAFVQGLAFRQNTAIGITANASSIYLDRTQVVGNTGGGITLTAGADGHLRNCFVGGDISDIAAMQVTSAEADILYSTLGAGFGSAAALRCNGAAAVHVRNSLLVARTDSPEVDCTPDSFEQSLSEADLGVMNINWFVAGGYATGNFHLSAMAPEEILTAGQWQVGDPPVDIDGNPRPTEPDSPDVAGADVP